VQHKRNGRRKRLRLVGMEAVRAPAPQRLLIGSSLSFAWTLSHASGISESTGDNTINRPYAALLPARLDGRLLSL